MKWFRKLICLLIGHDYEKAAFFSALRCNRCKKILTKKEISENDKYKKYENKL